MRPYMTLSAEQITTLQRIAGLHAAREIDLYPSDTALVEFEAYHPDEGEAVASGAIASNGRVHPRKGPEAA